MVVKYCKGCISCLYIKKLVAAEDVAGIDLGGNVAEGVVEAVGDDGFAAGLEGGEVVDDEAAEEGGAIGERGLVDDDLGTLGLDALHDALDGGLAEVIRVGLHRQAIDADDGGLSPTLTAILVVGAVGVPAGLGQHGVGDVVLARAVGLDDGGHHVLGHVLVVGEQLLRIFREAVAAIAEGGVVVVGADAGVEVFLDVVVLDGRDTAVEFLDFLGNDVNGCHMMVLGEEGGNAQADVACAGNGDLDIFEITHIFDFFIRFVIIVPGQLLGHIGKQLKQRGQLEQLCQTDESVFGRS